MIDTEKNRTTLSMLTALQVSITDTRISLANLAEDAEKIEILEEQKVK